MTKQRRSFSTEFKHDATVLVLDKGYTLSAASRAVGIGETALRRWVSPLQLERGGLTPEQQHIQQLDARIARLELEKDILKKANALLMSDGWNRAR
jgi:transposase